MESPRLFLLADNAAEQLVVLGPCKHSPDGVKCDPCWKRQLSAMSGPRLPLEERAVIKRRVGWLSQTTAPSSAR